MLDLEDIEAYILNLEKPFAFMKELYGTEGPIGFELTKDDMADIELERNGDNKYHNMEREAEKKFDVYAEQVAAQIGYRHIPWLGVTYFFIGVQMILTFMTQFHRKDQLTITACCIAILILQFPEDFRRASFRGLVAFMAISIVYDILWFTILYEDPDEDGGMERPVRNFASTVAFISLAWKVSSTLFDPY